MLYRSIYMICFLLSMLTSLYSQEQDSLEWAPVGATWWYGFDGQSPRVDCLKMEVIKDTTVNNKSASIIEGTILRSGLDTVPATKLYEQGRIVLHQQGDSVYYLRENKFELLYDFSLEVGDTMSIATPGLMEKERGKDTFILVYVESIGTTEIDGQKFRTQKLKYIKSNNHNTNYGIGEYVIETIGTNYFLLPYDDLLCDATCPIPLRCYQDDGLFYKAVDIACDTTYVISATGLKPGTRDVKLYPNPAPPGAELNIEGIEVREWYLWNMQGKLISRGDSSFGTETIEIPSPVRSGMYFMELRDGREQYIRKVIFQ